MANAVVGECEDPALEAWLAEATRGLGPMAKVGARREVCLRYDAILE